LREKELVDRENKGRAKRLAREIFAAAILFGAARTREGIKRLRGELKLGTGRNMENVSAEYTDQ
jgi:hypothetical protein